MVQAKIGNSFITILTSSTCCTVHFNAPHAGVSETARLRKLRLLDGAVSIDLLVGTGGGGLEVILAMTVLEFFDEFELEFNTAAIITYTL